MNLEKLLSENSGESQEKADTPAPVTAKSAVAADRSTLALVALLALAGGGLFVMHTQTRSFVKSGPAPAVGTAAAKRNVIDDSRNGLAKLELTIEQTRQMVEAVNSKKLAEPVAFELIGDPFEYTTQRPLEELLAKPEKEKPKADATVALQAELKKINLQSILYSSTRPSCLIDGQLYTEGSAVGSFTVEKIERERVQLRAGEHSFTLTMNR